MNCRNEAWQEAMFYEELLIQLSEVEDRRHVIRVQAWHEGSWHSVFDEATAMRRPIAEIRKALESRYKAFTERAREEK